MNTLRMRLLTLCVLAVSALALSCSSSDGLLGGGGSSGLDGDMSGTWNFKSDTGDPVTIAACSGDLAAFAFAPDEDFMISVHQEGNSVSGTVVLPCQKSTIGPDTVGVGDVTDLSAIQSTVDCAGFGASFEGTLAGAQFSGTIGVGDSSQALDLGVSGYVVGDEAALSVTSVRGEGLSGNCSVSGAYNGTR
ncbi:MAG: hypothetical protein GY716_23515 [bacterium]|nr:hypothetical protein [bacterium]